jgi:hypothetical protein
MPMTRSSTRAPRTTAAAKPQPSTLPTSVPPETEASDLNDTAQTEAVPPASPHLRDAEGRGSNPTSSDRNLGEQPAPEPQTIGTRAAAAASPSAPPSPSTEPGEGHSSDRLASNQLLNASEIVHSCSQGIGQEIVQDAGQEIGQDAVHVNAVSGDPDPSPPDQPLEHSGHLAHIPASDPRVTAALDVPAKPAPPFGILYANVRGLKQAAPTLQQRVAAEKPAFICLTEVWLNGESLDAEILPPGYKEFARRDRPNSTHGGVLILGLETLLVDELDLNQHYVPGQAEIVGVEYQGFCIYCAYTQNSTVSHVLFDSLCAIRESPVHGSKKVEAKQVIPSLQHISLPEQMHW